MPNVFKQFIVKRLNKVLYFFLLVYLFFASTAFSFDGPLQVKNQLPLSLNLNSPYLESAATENSFSVSLSHSSVYMIKKSKDWLVNLDMELTELSFRYRRIISNLFELGIEIPLLSFTGGFMDGFLNSYHQIFGFPDYGRCNRPNNEFLYKRRF
jgi:hypothetical protein